MDDTAANSSVANEGVQASDDLPVHVALVRYSNIRIKIYQLNDQQGSKILPYFYEPIVALDIKSVVSSGSQLRFKILPWNLEVEAKVVNRLRRLDQTSPLDMEKFHILPYREIQLVKKPGVVLMENVRLPKGASPYHQMNGSLALQLAVQLKRDRRPSGQSEPVRPGKFDPTFRPGTPMECSTFIDPLWNQFDQPRPTASGST